MNLPKTLFDGYKLLKQSHLVVNKDSDKTNISILQNILNDVQPKTPEELILYRFVQGMYNENSHRFLSFVENTSFECLVLWTGPRSIERCLGLYRVVYIKRARCGTSYSVSRFQSHKMRYGTANRTSRVHPHVKHRHKNTQISVKTIDHVSPNTTTQNDKSDDPQSETGVGLDDDTPDKIPEPLSLTRVMSVVVDEGITKEKMLWGDETEE